MPRRKITISKPFAELPTDANPSEIESVPWIRAFAHEREYPKHTEFGGKWLLFEPLKDIDTLWAKIRDALHSGWLGNSAKVATAMPNPNASNPNTRVICVYTYDSRDESDVKRVRQSLRDIGISRKIPYKADNATRAGKYANRGDSNTSLYYE